MSSRAIIHKILDPTAQRRALQLQLQQAGEGFFYPLSSKHATRLQMMWSAGKKEPRPKSQGAESL